MSSSSSSFGNPSTSSPPLSASLGSSSPSSAASLLSYSAGSAELDEEPMYSAVVESTARN